MSFITNRSVAQPGAGGESVCCGSCNVVHFAGGERVPRAGKVAVDNRVARLGRAGSGDMGRVRRSVYGAGCGDFNITCDPPMGTPIFHTPRPAAPAWCFRHTLEAVDDGRITVDDPGRRMHRLRTCRASESGGEDVNLSGGERSCGT